MKQTFCFVLLFLVSLGVAAQPAPEIITGKVFELEHGQQHPLTGANIYWAGTTQGTITKPDGSFSIQRKTSTNLLVVSFSGYKADTLIADQLNYFDIVLDNIHEIEGVEVVKRNKTTSFSMIDPIKVEKISETELLKAACCNLSESFETNASVDVSFTDAITGTKQIQLLGLAGPYTQITRENIPDIRGLSAIYGLEYIPGTWIESIQLNKGTGSVINGFESIAGQINVELRKPESAEKLHFNAYVNQDSRVETNLNLAQKINDKLSTGLLLHARTQQTQMDGNDDGFMDKPLGEQLIVLNRWKYVTPDRWESQLGVRATFNRSTGGQMGFPENTPSGLWGMNMETKRLEGWLKIGKVFDKNPSQSIGTQFSGLVHDHKSSFGKKQYAGNQKSFYGNFIFQSVQNVHHTYKAGFSFQFDDYTETLDSLTFLRQEIVPGVFAEYNLSPNDYFDLVMGMRADYHNLYGLFFTPRVHLRYALAEHSVMRFSVGRGQRTASIIAENNSVLASSRSFIIRPSEETYPYGLDKEVAWNFGTNFTQNFKLGYREGTLSADYYYSHFTSQVVVDMDQSPQEITFYNLEGKSYASSMQIQLDYELLPRFDIRLAYRWYELRTQYLSGMLQKPLVSPHRAFANLAYRTRNHWSFDYTLQWQSSKRIPSTESNPEAYRLSSHSPSFFLMNAQVSKQWAEKYDVYIGVENILGFKQPNPILASSDPFSPYFDASLIWGPVFGRMVYAGVRLRIP